MTSFPQIPHASGPKGEAFGTKPNIASTGLHTIKPNPNDQRPAPTAQPAEPAQMPLNLTRRGADQGVFTSDEQFMDEFFKENHNLPLGILLVGSVLTISHACYWLRYHDLLDTHVELMERLALDAGDALLAADAHLRNADIERLRYPLERARQFAAVSQRHYSERPSLARFESFITAYATLVEDLDRLRAFALGRAQRRRARSLVEEVTARAAAVREAVVAERE